jgi:hypothetical protein
MGLGKIQQGLIRAVFSENIAAGNIRAAVIGIIVIPTFLLVWQISKRIYTRIKRTFGGINAKKGCYVLKWSLKYDKLITRITWRKVMDLKAMFPNLNTMWVRWSAYEIMDYHDIRYLMPSPGAEAFHYNCAEQSEMLVADALELGRQITENAANVDRTCVAFTAHHGLLGLGEGKDAGPFSSDGMPPCYGAVNKKDYGEELKRFQTELQTLYRHFVSTRDGTEAFDTISAITGSLNYKLTSGQMPQLVWEADSLLSVLRLAYATLITTSSAPLKVCKNCGKVYYNPHAKSEFCGTKCRNYYNVKAFRARS